MFVSLVNTKTVDFMLPIAPTMQFREKNYFMYLKG